MYPESFFDAAGAQSVLVWERERAPYHVANLHVAVTEDDGVGGVPHWKHDPKWHAHGGRDQSVEGVDEQGLRLEHRVKNNMDTLRGQ